MSEHIEEIQITMPQSAVLTKGDFTRNFQRVLDLLVVMQEKQARAITQLQSEHQRLTGETKKTYDFHFQDLNKRVNELFVAEKVGAIDKHQKDMFGYLEQKIGKLINQKLRDVDVKVEQRAKPGPVGQQGIPGRPPTAKEIELALSPSVEAFRNSWEEKVQQAMARRGVGTGGGRQMRMTSFSFTGDGITTTFTLPDEPGAKGKAIWAFLNGQQLQLGAQITIAKKILTTTFVPENGSTIEGYLINF